ncbi:MAG TPA: alpha/beta hydrolase [Aliidongia sp.]|nr:alpha/beta hydrolase [Aliidongia sp.]
MPFVERQGVRLHYDESGRGYPLLFVHEFGSDAREWEQQVRALSRHYRCITFNARGYPPSDVPADPDQYGWEHARDDIGTVLDGLAIEKAHLVGLSMGAYAVLTFGLRYPDRVSALVVAGCGSGAPPSLRDAFIRDSQNNAHRFIEEGSAAVAETMGHSPTRIQLKHKDPRGWQEFMAHLRLHSAEGSSHTMARYQAGRPSLWEFEAELQRLDLPVLLAIGDEDEPCIEANLYLKRQIPNAGLWIAPNTGHAINLEEPAAFNRAVEDFLAAVERHSWRRGFGAA